MRAIERAEPFSHPSMKLALFPRALAALAAWLFMAPVLAFPPAPHHVIFGMVRDELGNPLAGENTELILETAAGVKLSTRIRSTGEPGQNYHLEIPMDSGITADAYMPTALRPSAPFKIRVRIGDAIYLPIEMSGDFAQLGQPGKKTRLNLTLGEDLDGDGLPDAWERNLIAALRLNKTLADIHPGSDADGDGMNNSDEYFAGTYAFDKEDGYALKIKSMRGAAARLEFMAIRGRTYTIHASADLVHWIQTPFRVETPGSATPAPAVLYWRANDVNILQVEAEPPEGSGGLRFFKLMIQ